MNLVSLLLLVSVLLFLLFLFFFFFDVELASCPEFRLATSLVSTNLTKTNSPASLNISHTKISFKQTLLYDSAIFAIIKSTFSSALIIPIRK